MEVHLLCVPHAVAEAILQDTELSPEAIAWSLFNSKPEWPSPGELVIELNSKPDSHGNAWFVHSPVRTHSFFYPSGKTHESLNTDAVDYTLRHYLPCPAWS